jgi:hypothetical protein
MERKVLHGSRLRSAGYDERARRLEIEFADGGVRVYKEVPAEVARRLFSAPNAGAYWEDRIADEYPAEAGTGGRDAEARAKLDSLFGKK